MHGELAHEPRCGNWELMDLIDFPNMFCYFKIMLKEKIELGKKKLQTGGIAAAIIAILISFFIHYLYKYTFICLDPEICEKIKAPMLEVLH